MMYFTLRYKNLIKLIQFQMLLGLTKTSILFDTESVSFFIYKVIIQFNISNIESVKNLFCSV